MSAETLGPCGETSVDIEPSWPKPKLLGRRVQTEDNSVSAATKACERPRDYSLRAAQ